MNPQPKATLTWSDFSKVEMRVGTIRDAVYFKAAKNPAYKMKIDFGPYGERKTSAQLATLYQPEDLIGKQVICVVNFPPKQIATMMSECLVLGTLGENNEITILNPERTVENGLRIG